MAVQLVDALHDRVGYDKATACEFIGVSDKSYYRWRQDVPKSKRKPKVRREPLLHPILESDTQEVEPDRLERRGGDAPAVAIYIRGDEVELSVDISREDARRLRGVLQSLSKVFGDS